MPPLEPVDDAGQHRDDGVQEQAAADQGVLRRGAPPITAGVDRQVKRVEPHSLAGEVDAGAPDGARQPGVLIFGIDDVNLDAPIQAAQHFQLDQVGLPGPGPSQDDRVVVVAREAVPVHQPLAADVVSVEHPAGGGHAGGIGRGQVG